MWERGEWKGKEEWEGGHSSSQSSSFFLSHLQMRSSNLPLPPKAVLTNTSSLVQSFWSPFLSLTWVTSLYFCVVPSNRDVSSERKGRKNEKIRRKIPQVQSGQRGSSSYLKSRWVEEERKTFVLRKWLFSMFWYVVVANNNRRSPPWEAVSSSPDTF